MINLIPPSARKKVVYEYWIRVVIVWLSLLLVAMGIIAILQVPSYIILSSQLHGYELAYTTAKDQAEDFSDAEAEVKEANSLAKHVYHAERVLTPSQAIEILDNIAGREVTIVSYDVSSEGGEVKSVVIRGVASTRSVLSTFSRSITEHPLFSEANVPFSNLAKDVDIDFEISVLAVTPE